MTPLLHWALLTSSFIIITLLGWLGLTVVLTAERRRWAVWLVSLTMCSGAAFFAVHAIVLCRSAYDGNALMMSEWPIAWVVGILQPCAWYVVVLWHVGFWENRRAIRHARLHTGAFVAMLGTLGAAALMVANEPMIRRDPLLLFSRFDPAIILAGPYVSGFPLFALIYLGFLVLYTGFALDALIHPAPSSRMMGDLARNRARPWLMATSVVLLLVSLLVCATLLWFMPDMLQMTVLDLPPSTAQALVWVDLAVSLLVAGAVVLIGQAVVSYEIFTGKTLPRRGLLRSWRAAVIFALGFSAVVALGPVRDSAPIFMALGMALIVTSFYAIYNARSFAEQERALAAVRSFSAGSRLDDALAPRVGEEDVAAPFHALCTQVLGVRSACLWPLGAHASLLSPLAYGMPMPSGVGSLAAQATAPQTLCLPLEHTPDLHWAVPLWDARGLCGLFLLGQKTDDGLFTQEEMTVARAAGERLLDTLASAELARRLVHLQRARLAESQVADRRTRRVLHDDVLPQVHTTMLALSAGQASAADAVTALADMHRQIANLLHELPAGRAATVRDGVLPALRQLVTSELNDAFDTVRWEITPEGEARLAALPPVSAEVLYGASREALRNAARHGRAEGDPRPLHLRIQVQPDRLTIEDDGRGVASPAQAGGAGQGMMLHSTMMAVIGGVWEMANTPHAGTRVTLVLPPEG